MPNRTVVSETQKQTALIELINQINMTLKAYEVSRKPFSETGRRWGYFFLTITGFLAFPFFRGLFRNDDLTRKKIAKVEATQKEFRKISRWITRETTLNPNPYLDNIVKDLLSLQISNNNLNNDYEKFHLSKQQVLILGSKNKPSFFQSGLTSTIESCFKLIEDFRNKYDLFPSSTVQVSANLGSPPPDRNNSNYQPPPAYSSASYIAPVSAPPLPPAFNPYAQQGYQPDQANPTYRRT